MINVHILFLRTCLVLSSFVPVLVWANELPDDVTKFMENRELCNHFRGEEPYDDERRAFLYKSVMKICKGTDKELESLKEKYKEQSEIMSSLSIFEDKIGL